jgi:CRP-like cAMP-binding protein/small-conductance mechanosensitive channel
MPLDTLSRVEWYGYPLTTIVFFVLAVIVMRSASAERKRVLRTAGLYVVGVLAELVGEVARWRGFDKTYKYLHEFAVLIAAICLIFVACILIFRVIAPRLGLYPPRILQDVLFVVALIGFGLVRLADKGLDPGSIFTTSALITAVVALSLQDTLGNILGGLALQLDRSIQVGDWVEIDRVAGQVVEIGWRQTSIETNNWETIVVPNSVLVKNRFLVLGRRTGRPVQHRRWIPFFVDAQHPPDVVLDAVQGSLRSMDMLNVAKDPAPQCFLLELAESPARYAVSYWLTDLTAMNPTDSAIRVQAFLALKRIGIAIAVPGRNVLLTEETVEKRQLRQEQEMAQRMVALRTVGLFHGFSVDELNQLAERLQPAPYLAGDTLVRQGAEAVRLYIIVEGRADVYVQGDAGERAKVAELGPGDFFGEMALMTGEPRTATVTAKTPMLVYRLDKDSFRDLIVSRPDVAEEISTILAKRRAQLDATRENLDADAMAARTAATRHVIREKIWQFFGLQD